MKTRIALSALLAVALCISACMNDNEADDESPRVPRGIGTSPSSIDAGLEENGIGTSPSLQAVSPCAVWHDLDETAARARADRGDHPDVVQYTIGHSSCSDIIWMTNYWWPGETFIRYYP